MKKTKNIPKGFRLIAHGLPRLGRNCLVLDKYGKTYRGIFTDTSFYPEEIVFEDIHYTDHRIHDIVAWKDGRIK